MDTHEIRDLIEMISQSTVSELELEREGFKLRLVKAGPSAAPVATVVPVAALEGEAAPAAAAAPASAPPVEAVEEGLEEITTPFVGTFYRAPSPDTDPFVEVGTKVRKGQVLCIVEAMKLMNELESEIEGEVVEILASNGQPVEYGQVLFRMRPMN